ncbi:MAG: aldo/keto reductase [Rhodospirillales bacterium]|nr:aldo/keto reductase [Rhodospirillales bacterium]
MRYNPLGRTDMQVSRICMGAMTFGEQNTEEEAFRMMDMCLDMGVNFFDTAEMYSFPSSPKTQGDSERAVGNWMAARGNRDKIIVATKITGPDEPGGNFSHVRGGDLNFGRKQLEDAVDQSLERLKTDYIDLYQLHWSERTMNSFGKLGYEHVEDEVWTPFEDVLASLGEMMAAGKIRAIGCSNESPWGLMKMLELADRTGLPRMASIQNPYNLLNRTYEVGLSEVSIREDCGLLAYSPLAFGVLSGKYLNGAKPPKGRLTIYPQYSRYTAPGAVKATEAYVKIATEHGLDPSQMALAYVNTRRFMTSNIIGATTCEQLEANILSDNLVLTDSVLEEIEKIHTMAPNPTP